MSQLRKIHVLHIVSGDLWAGAEAQLFTLVTTLNNQLTTNVSVAILNHGILEKKLREAGIEVFVLDESKLNSLNIFSQLISLIRRIKPDVIHTHRSKENIIGSIAARLSGNIPTLRTAHGAPEHRPAWYHIPKMIIRFIDRFCGRFLQKRIIAVSEDLAGMLAKKYPPNRIRVIQNGIDIERIAQSENPPETMQGRYKVGIVGRLVPVKRVDIFIRTAHRLLREHSELNLSFHIFGDGPLRDELEGLNKQFDTHLRVNFEGHCHDMHSEIKSLDALLMTSDHEGLPMVLLEAMALKIPVVAHAVGGIQPLLDNGSCGIMVKEHNPEGYAEAIVKLTCEPNLRNKITNNAFARINEHYSAELNADSYLQQYNALTAV